ncbi:neutral/alkaline non-lysosomal ceramidase N-terminal domain-containing protein [Moorella sp. Hama-1]|uniref:neutral/alkaline non-lysosomal ceramidase N-terminal domain-containing protein n=1 Tax=Moorella sp. Hama-1 TaxID=2138101 RepID=UPI00137B19D7|nr:neutral/alkaline non-lysosomal ceramidase N-terminal domain-containing protein [Moorella sp. Hama-1]BCV22319.1 alkaline ceramidase [Moorella sp. Hama-1]
MENLKLGTAKIDISPKNPIPLAGFAHRQGNFENVIHPLHARILFFEQTEADGTRQNVLIVSADLIWWGSERIPVLKERLQREFGFTFSSMLFHATHNHSGPQTSGWFTPSLGPLDIRYVEALEDRIIDGVRSALQNLESVRMDRGTGYCGFSINRRKVVEGEMTMAPNPDGPTDPEVTVIRFVRETGSTKALLVHYACHATTTGDNFVSSEFPGIAMDYLEDKIGGTTVAAYLQGYCGDVRPALIRDGAFYRGDDQEVCRLGQTLGDEVLRVIQSQMEALQTSRIISQTLTVDLPLQNLPTRSELKTKSAEGGIYAEWAEILMKHPERIHSSVPLEMTWVHLAEGLSLLTANAEMVVSYGLFIKDKFARRILPVGYTNGMIGYVPTARQIGEGGYESKDSVLYFGQPAPFDPLVEERICTEIQRLAERKDETCR